MHPATKYSNAKAIQTIEKSSMHMFIIIVIKQMKMRELKNLLYVLQFFCYEK